MNPEAKEDKYLVGELDGKIFVKFVGNATMKNSKTLEEFFTNLFKGEKSDVIFDFDECNYMDSTMLGLIAKTSLKMKKQWNLTIYAVNLSNAVKTSLKSTGVDKLMVILENEETAEKAKEIQVEKLEIKDFDSKEEKTIHILDAHKTLMGLSKENETVFQNVVNLLEKELKK